MRRGLGIGGLLASAAAMLALASPAAAFTATEGQQFSGQIASAFIACASTNGGETFDCDTLPGTLGAQITWGDGSATATGTATKSADCTTNNPTCIYDISGTHTYAEEGTFTVSWSVPNSNGPVSQNPKRGTATASVQDAPLIDPTKMGGLQSTEGAPGTFELGSFIDTNPGGTASDFTASIDWGDNTPASAGSVAANGAGGFDVTGTHTFTSAATRTVTATVNDIGGASTMIVTRIVVHDAPLTAHAATGLTAVEGASRALTLATFTDADPGAAVSDYSATVQWGDVSASSTGMIVANGSGGFSVNASHAYAEEGTWTATVSIVDVGGATATASPTIAVADAPLTVRSIGLAGVAGNKISGPVATFTDADPAGALADYTATIDWGDVSASSTGMIVANGSGGFTVSGSHAYAKAGSYHATVTVDDVGGATASAADAIAIASAVKGAVSSALEWSFDFNARFTTVTMLAVHGPPAGGVVIVNCNRGGCPFRTRTLHVHHGTRRQAPGAVSLLNLAGPFGHAKLRPHARITVEITAPGLVGKYYRFTTRLAKAPAVATACLAPGSAKPGVGC